jgi:hypothetical protein
MKEIQLLTALFTIHNMPKALILFGAFATVWAVWLLMLYCWFISTFKQQEKELETLAGTAFQQNKDVAELPLQIEADQFPENPVEICLF